MQEMIPLVRDEAAELVAGSFLEGAPVIALSARTGDGLDQLRDGPSPDCDGSAGAFR